MLSNKHITEIREIISPAELLEKYAPSEGDIAFILQSRATIEDILIGKDKRLMVIVGPCSIHDVDAAIEYARFLKDLQSQTPNLFLVMRVYFEKPRSRLGWKGLIYDPDLDDSFQINKGLEIARRLLLTLAQLRIPAGCEFLDTLTPQYLSDLVSWGAIGARTSESQIHRQLASGLSMPIGFKNLTSGDYDKAIDGILSASYPHHFLGIDEQGNVSHVQTKGNPYSHLILRGGEYPNYDESTIKKTSAALVKETITTGIVVDCSHGNSQKDHNRQLLVALHIMRQRMKSPDHRIYGIMLESNLQKGKQAHHPKNVKALKRGVSITDACIDVQATRHLLHMLNAPELISGRSITEIRTVMRDYDSRIHTNILESSSPRLILSKNILEEDKEVVDLCRGKPNEEYLSMMITLRLSLSERLAELKLSESPFEYMRLQNDFLPLITRRDVESDIMRRFQDPIFLKIMELSKRIQVRCLEILTNEVRMGYLFGPGTFSHEVIQQFRGKHIPYPSVDALTDALNANEIDYMIIPSYNSIIGKIYSTKAYCIQGALDHPIELSLYSNSSTHLDAENLYIEPHILKECETYIQKIIRKNTIHTSNSVEGCIACIQDKQHGIKSLTVSSKRNQSNFLSTIATDLVPHNITTFSFVSKRDKLLDHQGGYDTSSYSLPESMELLCRI